MTIVSTWGYLDPDNYDDAARAERLHQISLQYPGAIRDQADGLTTIISCQTARYRNYNDGNKYPLTLDLMDIALAYIGGTSGRWNYDAAPDVNENHIRTNLFDVSYSDVMAPVIERRNELRLVYVEDASTDHVFYPMMRNTHRDSTSMLCNMFIGFVVADLVHIGHRDWQRHVGSQKTDAQIAEAAIANINREISDRFDNRFSYQVTSKTTADDKKRRYSWTTGINIFGNVPKVVNHLVILPASS